MSRILLRPILKSPLKEEALICSKCGAALPDGSQFCSQCGNPLSTAQYTPPVSTTQYAPSIATVPGAPLPEAQTSGKAIASLVCGILNVFPLFIVAIVLGHISLSEIRKSAGRLKGEGLAIAGLVLGYLGIVAIPLILIIAAIAIPNLLRAKIVANENSALHSVRMLETAEMSYRTEHQNEGFTCNLSDLSSILSDSALLSGQKNGYNFALQNCTAESDGGAITKFQVAATPMSKASGGKAFCADETRVIRFERSGSADDCFRQAATAQ